MEQRDRHRQRGREPDDDRPVRRRRRFVGEIGDGRDNQEEDAVAGRNARPAALNPPGTSKDCLAVLWQWPIPIRFD